jgi:uncharacterized membrane protein
LTKKTVRVLVVGETTFRIHTHFKGFAAYETGYCTLSLAPFIERFMDTGIELSLLPNHEVSLCFPLTVEEMNAYDAIIISDAPADSFLLHPNTLNGERRPNRLKVIGDYVRRGRGFAMIGGWMSYGGFHGKAHYAYSPLAELLPVAIDRGDDRMETPEGVVPVVELDHPVLSGLPAEWPDFLGYNRFEARRGETLLSFRETGDPLLVVDTVGDGRVACFASDILPHWGSPRFQEWAGYVPFWEQLFTWLAGQRSN